MRGGGAQGSNGFLGPSSISMRKKEAPHIFCQAEDGGASLDEASFFFRQKRRMISEKEEAGDRTYCIMRAGKGVGNFQELKCLVLTRLVVKIVGPFWVRKSAKGTGSWKGFS